MKKQIKTIQSWTGVFKKKNALVTTCDTQEELEQAFKPPKVVGSFHSYNKSALADNVIVLGEGFKKLEYDEVTQTCRVGAAVTVNELMSFLLDHHRRLINRGNYGKQTFVGAALNGTHGFGPDATMYDQIISKKEYNGVITEVTIDTSPLTRSKVDMYTTYLSQIRGQAYQRFYAVLPYSNKNPICLVVEHEPYEGKEEHKNHEHLPIKKIPLTLRLWWWADGRFPIIRKYFQRASDLIRIPDKVMYTNSHDYDSLYHPFKGIDGTGEYKFSLWAYKPTHVSYNMALFIKPEDTEHFIQFAIEKGEKLKSGLFRNFIGVRELTTKSDYEHAGNFEGPVNAVDFYCSPWNAKYLIELQRILQDKFWTRPHNGKTVK